MLTVDSRYTKMQQRARCGALKLACDHIASDFEFKDIRLVIPASLRAAASISAAESALQSACVSDCWVLTPSVPAPRMLASARWVLLRPAAEEERAVDDISQHDDTGAVVSFQWFFWGFSLAFSETGSAFIGDAHHPAEYFGLKGVLEQPSIGSTRIPSIVFCVYQLMFAAITPILAIGAVAERSKLGPLMVFVFVWSTLVYDPIACWTWNSNGWSFVLGGLDFAGGTPVHISSGTAGLTISIYLGKRRGWGTERLAYKPHNTNYVVLGTVFLWFRWFGFNGGSALSANLRVAQACIVTNLAASVGGLTWMLWDYRLEKKWSAVGFCSGAIAGLVAITPGRCCSASQRGRSAISRRSSSSSSTATMPSMSGGRGGGWKRADASCAPPGEEGEQRGEQGGREGRRQRDATPMSCAYALLHFGASHRDVRWLLIVVAVLLSL
ncbi:Rh-like protein/ammonium transporter [Athelia psychrophila]|uniref:Rh-like protein/ammonium transporter n=1 Tax=Athelia psychrophila TaxID=1759441 RepID=A0A165ZTK7_9AGAM|nr:Rh-like protein/ammonium transporter [Fibularhizoctonia sp. CBS 109695]